jgi:hypothetical protein
MVIVISSNCTKVVVLLPACIKNLRGTVSLIPIEKNYYEGGVEFDP